MKFSQLKQTQGFTLIELLVAAIVSSAILGVSLALINTQRHQFLSDQNRSQANQNLRAAIDLIGADIKIAGELLDGSQNLPVIQLLDGTGVDGATNEHDRLILQRKLIAASLTTCADISASSSTRDIVVATKAVLPTESNCGFQVDEDNGNASGKAADAIIDSLNDFRDYRCSAGTTDGCDNNRTTLPANAAACDDECTVALILNPTNGNNELFYYTNEGCEDDSSGTDCAKHIAYANDNTNPNDHEVIRNVVNGIPLESSNWQYDYPAGSLIYIFEERKYSFDDDTGILNLTLNREDEWNEPSATTSNGQPLQLVNQLDDFQVQVGESDDDDNDSTTAPIIVSRDEFNTAVASTSYVDWRRVHRVRVSLSASNPSQSDLVNLPRGGCNGQPNTPGLCLSSEFFPRNSLSK